MIISGVRGHQPGIKFGQALDFGHRDQMGAPEPAAFAFHPALLMRPADPGLAVERIKPHVRPEQHPSIRFSAVAPKQHSLNRRFEVVVADLVERYPSNMRVSFVKSGTGPVQS